MNRKQFGQVSLAKSQTVDKSHSGIKSAAEGIVMKLLYLFSHSLEEIDK